MKNFLALIVLFFSLTASANDVVTSLHDLFGGGIHTGVTPANDLCMVNITYNSGRAEIVAMMGHTSITKVIYRGTNYRFNAGRREFLSSDNQSTFRTLAVDDYQTYTVTAEVNESGSEVAIECILSR